MMLVRKRSDFIMLLSDSLPSDSADFKIIRGTLEIVESATYEYFVFFDQTIKRNGSSK